MHTNLTQYEPFPLRTLALIRTLFNTNLIRYEPFHTNLCLRTFSFANLFRYELKHMNYLHANFFWYEPCIRTLSDANLFRYELQQLRTLCNTSFIRYEPLHTNLCLRTFSHTNILFTNLGPGSPGAVDSIEISGAQHGTPK